MGSSEARPRVLVTGAGGPSAVTLVRSYLARGDVEVRAADIDPFAAGLYLVGPDRRHLLLRGDDPGFVDHVLALCRAEQIRVLIPTVDAELLPLARRAAAFEALGTTLVNPSADTCGVCLDKLALVERCRPVVRVPRTWLLDGPAPDLPLPVIVKPRRGSGSRNITLVREPSQWAAVTWDEELIAQEYLPGEEYSVDVLAARDGVIAAVPRSRLKVDSGISVAGRTHHDPELEEFAVAVAGAVGLVGVANVQVRRDAEGRPALLEVNPRFPGAMPLTVRAGVDMPSLVLDAALGGSYPSGRLAFEEVAVVRYWEEQWVPVAELAALEAPAMAGVAVKAGG